MAIKPIVVGIDGSEPSLRAVDWATREAVLRDVPLRIVSVCAIEPRINWAVPPGSPHAHGPIAIVPDQS